jgi:hypothetical protein
MKKSAQFSLVTTAITVGTLYAGAWRAEADSFYIQTNLVSDIPGARGHHRPNTGEPLGYISYRHEPHLDFEPGYQ